MSWMTPELVDQTAEILKKFPRAGRTLVSEMLNVSEYKARELVNEAQHVKEEPIGPTIATFDLETTNLKGDIGRLLCGSILSYPAMEMVTYRIDDYGCKYSDDRQLAVDIRDHIEKHNISCGWFSKGFDITFLNTRLVQNGERPMNRMLHVDPIWYFRGYRGLKPRSSKMSVVAEFFDIERKQDVDVKVWIDASAGDREALDILVDRCESDVRITSELMQQAFDLGLVRNIQMYP